MELDAQARELIEQLGRYNAPPIETLTPQAARCVPLLDYAARDLVASQIAARLLTVASPMPEQVARVYHEVIDGPGGDLLLRVYQPDGPGPFPVLVYFHGGGWVIANLDVYDSSCRALTNAAGSVVVSVAYRQAPEHKFPAAVHDAYAALQWVIANAARVNGDPAYVAVGGESAGGNLAAVCCLMAREQGGAMPVHQLLIYPVTDFGFTTPSFQEHADARPLSSAMMPWFRKHYLRTDVDVDDFHASPRRAPHHRDLPPATVITAENDPLRDDGRLYAEQLRAAGNAASWYHYAGVMHEFFGLSGLLTQAGDAVQQAARELKESFERRPAVMRAR